MYKLFALPTEETIQHLEEIFQGLNFEVNWDGLGVELGSSQAPITADDSRTYQALPGGLNVWYDSATAKSNLIMPLIPSPEMAARHDEVGDAWGRRFIPFLVLGPDPVLRRHRRGLINSLATRLVDFPPLLTFHAETVLSDDAVVPSQADFHEDIVQNGLIPAQVFTEGIDS